MDTYWPKYNLKINKISEKMIKFNSKNEVNFIENGHYNHTRDLMAITIAFLNSHNKKTNILDYGSNIASISNFQNKIETKNITFNIFDPYHNNRMKINNLKKLNFKIINNKKKFINKKFDLLHFGSSIQYQDNFFNEFNSFLKNLSKVILITHTPFSSEKSYKSKQSNHKNLIQNIYSLTKLNNLFKKNKFKLIFKSRNDDKYISCVNKKYKSYSLNLLFIK
jgi:hypothetical protein